MNIYRNETLIYSVEIDESTIFSSELMGADKVVCSFISNVSLTILVGDYVLVEGQKYTIVGEIFKQQIGVSLYRFELQFFGAIYQLYNSLIKHLGRTKISYFGTPAEMLGLIVGSMGTGWYVGGSPTLEPQLFEFKDTSCRVALSDIAQKFKLEYYVENNNIYLVEQAGAEKALSLGYGKNQGAYDITRQSTSSTFATVWYAFGGSTNLPAGYREGSDRLTLNAPLEYNTTELGRREGVIEIDYVYPRRTSTITTVVTPLIVIDSTLDFDLNAQNITDGQAKIVFKSGELNGQEFFITKYDNATKQITFQTNKDESGYETPNSTFGVAVGDKYTLIGITMPTSYITAAENELYTLASDYASKNSRPEFSITVNVDEKYIRDGGYAYELEAGDTISINAPSLNFEGLLRIQSISYPLVNPNKIILTLSNAVVYSVSEQLVKEVKQAGKNIVKLTRGYNAIKARMGWKTTQELLNMTFDTDGYFDMGNIRPLSVETAMLVVGVKSQQFILQVVIEPNFEGSANVVKVNSGILVHYLIEETIRTWQIAGQTVTIPDSNARYIYAKCNRVDYTDGSLVFSTEQIKPNDSPTYYYFLVGVLHSVLEGVRWISLTYGATAINGRFIKTGRIQSFDGSTYFDLDLAEIGGKISFVDADGNTKGLETLNQELLDFVNTTYPADQGTVQTQIDGKIEAWFQATAPAWTEPERTKHDKDMWYDTDDKKLYRFSASTNTWIRIEDADALAAYEAASHAQDTADGKRRTFIATPYPPYDVGDLWANGTFLKKCIVSRDETGSYVSTDWDDATAYDNTITTINGGVVTSGTVQLAGDDTSIKAGITGVGTTDTDVRVWAGASFVNRAVAAFRVLQSGAMYATNAIIEGYINATSGKFGVLEILGNSIINDYISQAQIILKNDTDSQMVAIGTNVKAGTALDKACAIFEQKGTGVAGWNIGSEHRASGSSYRNVAIWAAEGESILEQALINGRNTVTHTLNHQNISIDTTSYDVVCIEPIGADDSGVTFTGTPNAGKEIKVVNLNMGKAMFIYDSIRGYSAVIIPQGGAVTCVYTGAYWYVCGQNFS